MFNLHFRINQVFIDADTQTVVAMSPKVLTTFIHGALRDGFREFHGRDHASDGRYPSLPVAAKFPMPSVGGYIDALARPRRFEAYGFVRNPYWRLHSAWRNKFHDAWYKIEAGKLRGYPPSVRHTDLPRLRQFAAERGLQGAEEHEMPSFETFVEFVAANRDLRRNKHWRAQTKTLQLSHFRHMHIHRVEDGIEDGMTAIFSRLGFGAEWISQRLANPKNVSSVISGNPYDEGLANLIFNSFREDFTRFGYHKDSWQVMELRKHAAVA